MRKNKSDMLSMCKFALPGNVSFRFTSSIGRVSEVERFKHVVS